MRSTIYSFFTTLLLMTTAPSLAHEGHDAPAPTFTEAEQHTPTPLPDRVVLTWPGDPKTSIAVSWRTHASIAESVIEIAPGELLRGNLRTGQVPGARVVEGVCSPFDSDLGTWAQHTVRVDDLAPGKMHAYRVGDGTHWSEWHQFRTASAEPEPFTFVYFGDAQNAVRAMWSRVVREANQHAPRSAFMLHAGDLVNRGNRDAEWGEWFGAGAWLNGMIPSIASPGNHEYGEGLSRHWRPQFSFPLNGPPGLEETVYWVDYQGARIISLNSNEQIERQTLWLDSVLSDPNRPKWTFVTFHHPIFSAAKERDNARLRAAWRPVLEKHGVDMVLQGHDHAYARSGLGGPKNVSDGVSGKSSNTVYVVSVSGPKMYELQEKWDVPRVASGVQLFQVIRVSPDEIKYEARLATGELYDSFTLRKDESGQAELHEHEVETPEINAKQAEAE
ncbi:purple acid phosphatase family protein [Posidoniimonas corsicana]|nr:metallophosphoesterase family protein [Posidoniimonas corsicana]